MDPVTALERIAYLLDRAREPSYKVRAYLRGRQEDLLGELGEWYAAHGDEGLATARFRQALALNPESVRARSGMARLGAVTEADAR